MEAGSIGTLGCNYVGGDISVYDEPYDSDCLSFIEVETIVKPYGYNVGDLVYYKEPEKSLNEGLRLISSDHDVLQMVKCHKGEQVIVLYLVSFGANGGVSDIDENDADIDEETERRGIGVNDLFWDTVLSSDDELFDVDVDTCQSMYSGAGPSKEGAGPSSECVGLSTENPTMRDPEKGKKPMVEDEEAHVLDGDIYVMLLAFLSLRC